MPALLSLAAAAVSLACAAGPGDLASLKPGQAVGSFQTEALYLDASGAPKGARFRHKGGAVVDVLYFDSVPQVSVDFKAPPDDERGAPHTLEHLLLGKGASGRRLNTLMPVRMGQYTAGTDHDITNYQFSSAAGPAEFYELLDVFLGALIRPDFTDEEIRREVAHDVALEEDGKLKLEEAGTVYTEMVSRMEQPATVFWDQAGRMLFGADHPLARNQGGAPDGIWELTPKAIRDFHDAHYRLDSRMELIAALPRDWSAADFLVRLDSAIARLEPPTPAAEPRDLPPFRPLAEREIRVGAYPSSDATAPQDALLVWPAVPTLRAEEKTRLDLALELIAGDIPFLAGDYLDKPVRKVVPGAPSPSWSIGAQAVPASYVSAQISGLPAAALTQETLGALRDAIMERVRWLRDLKPGAPSLAEISEKALARIRSHHRATARWLEGPPRFGERSTDTSWHRYLDQLALEPAFEKSLSDDAALDRLAADLKDGKNPWAAPLERAGMLEPPYVSAAAPDPGLLELQKKHKVERLRAKVERLEAEYKLPEAQALERYRAETASTTARLEALAAAQERPSFLREPPLELDKIDWSETRLPSGPPLVVTRFDTPFTDVSVAFDLNGIDAKDRELMPALASAIRGVGVLTAAGEKLDPNKAYDRVTSDIWGAEVDVVADGDTDRAELVFTAHASSAAEIPAATGWLANYILRPDLSLQSRDGLKSQITSILQTRRAIFQSDDESWVQDAAAAYRNQDKPLYMHAISPFTAMRDLNRLRWRLEEPSPAELEVIKSTAAAARLAADAPDRAEAEKRLAAVPGEFGEYLRWEFSHLPDDSWRGDLRRLVDDYLADLGRSQETIRRLQNVARRVLVRAGARAHLNGSAENVAAAARALDDLLAKLPVGEKSSPPKHEPLVLERLRERFPGLARPTHVALVNESGKTGSIVVSAPAPNYRSLGQNDLLDALALGVLAGGGGHSLYMKTWSAGLAYGNGLAQGASVGRATYYADKCPDPAQTLRFVADTAASFKLDDPSLLEYSLADAFNEYRAGQDFSSRGSALADDLQAGNRPEVVRAFKSSLLKIARAPGTLAAVNARFQPALGRVLIGLPGGKVSASPAASAVFIGPESLIARYEAFVRERGEASRVIRLYPRDFWP